MEAGKTNGTQPALSREEYEKKYAANERLEGTGAETTVHMPCPFCAEPDFAVEKLIGFAEALGTEHVCKHCNRGAKTLVKEKGNVTSLLMFQTRGDPPPPYMSWMPREPA